MTILISNDDGIDAPGIRALTDLALEFADRVVVVAPNRCFSGMSHAITMHSPIFVDKVLDTTYDNGKHLEMYATNGSPVDCIKIALDEIIKHELPDMILSGINHGSNSNISVIYSGTMGAATEGAFYNIPSIGFSLTTHDQSADLTPTIHFARQVITKALSYPALTPTLCWNVNIPNLPLEQIKGITFARQTVGLWREDFLHNRDPRGKDYYWMSGRFYNSEPGATQSDEYQLSEGWVTIVPVQMDLTNYRFLEDNNWTF